MLPTTLVGSFPLDYSIANIRKTLEDQFKLGVTFPVLPQLRDFVYIYLQPLLAQGIVLKEGLGYRLAKDINEAEIEVPEDVLIAADVAREMGLKYRVPITGPFTLASKIALPNGRIGDISTSAVTEKKTLESIVEYMGKLARKIDSEVKGHLYCVDEPVLAVIVGSRNIMYGYSPEFIHDKLDYVLSNLSGEMRGIHVCGKLPPLLKQILLNLQNAGFLDHEHSDFPANRTYYSREELLKSSKKLGYGIISPSKPSVENKEIVLSLAKDAYDRYGDAIAFFKPDCGFGGLKGYLGGREYEEIVLEKIKLLVEVAEEVS
ncbi:MAG: hypothetical protein ABWK01_09550 [Infirmifilum sp.]